MCKKLDHKYVTYLANTIARKSGHNEATEIKFKSCKRGFVESSTAYGYCKYSTDEYVCNAYLNKFGWKNTYYQHAECVVVLPLRYKRMNER